MRRLSICMLVLLAVITASAQQRIPCDRSQRDGTAATRAGDSRLYHSIPWEGTVHIPVILAAYSDVGFQTSDAEQRASWDAKLNQVGYAEHGAVGSAADYFRKQSGGRLNVVFDVLGPVTLPNTRVYYGGNKNDKASEDQHAEDMIIHACEACDADFSPYDNDGDGLIDLVLVIYAGNGENRGGPADAVWPHKYVVPGSHKVGGLLLGDYICVSELEKSGREDGHGVICHEFSHALGLPDIYPIGSDLFSLFDEWDLMDGGDYTNYGYSPPNYSAFERSLVGWVELKELSEATVVTGMPAWDDEPVAYAVYNSYDREEYLILENRQQRGYDSFVPGNGLIVTYVNHYYHGLSPNIYNMYQVTLIASDNRTYSDYKELYGSAMYTDEGRNRYLSMSAYPYIEEGELRNDAVATTTTPANPLKKDITNIRMAADGTISFDFRNESTGIAAPPSALQEDDAWYDLYGRRLLGKPSRKGIYLHNKKKVAL